MTNYLQSIVIKKTAMRQIRVKPSNQAAIIAALIEAGYTAVPCKAHLSEQEYEMNVFSSFQDWSEDSIQNMTGIETNASGHQAHKVIYSLRDQGTIN